MSIKKNKMSIEDKQGRLGELLLRWALLAYTDINHPLAEYAENLSPKGFKQRVLIAGLIVIPDLLAEELKNPSFRNKNTRNTELFNESEYNQWEQLKRAATTNDPSVDKLRQLIIKPIMQSLMIDAFLDSAHPLHYAHKLITELVYSKNATEAAKLEAIKEGSADRFHRLDIGITAAMTRFTAKVGISLKNSKQGGAKNPSPVNKFFTRELKNNSELKRDDLIKMLEQYCKGDDDDEIGVMSCEGKANAIKKRDTRRFIYTDEKNEEVIVKVENLDSTISKIRLKLKEVN